MSHLNHSLILCGFTSSGKTRIGRRAAGMLGVSRLSIPTST